MRDVAALAGVSLKTVSRVINAEPGVSAALTSKVYAAIDRLDYRQDFAASALRRADRRTASVGMVLEDVSNPYSAAVHRAFENVAHDRGVLVLAGSSDEDEARERSLVAAFTTRRVDGLVMMPAGHDHSYLVAERRAGTAFVFIDRPPCFFDADSVMVDNADGARRGVSHLVEHGHQRIAFLGDLHTIATAEARAAGYTAALERAGLRFDPALVRTDLRSIDAAQAAIAALLTLPDPPTAVFAAQNLLTIAAVRELRRQQLHEHVAVVGFDDILLADLLQPAVTVIAQDPTAIGRRAAEILFARIDGDTTPSRHDVIATQLIVRGSGEIRPQAQP